MKTIVNKLRFALLLGFLVMSVTAWAQRANIEKMSISTQMFLDQIEKKADFTPQVDQSKFASPRHTVHEGREILLPFAKPDTINGQVFMSAFVRISSDEVASQLEALGVEIQSRFDKGLMTTLIPIEKIEEVASLAGVTRINAASPMRILTNNARQTTNVDDALTLSNDAITAGLTKKFDGAGVILGVIDTGIDFQHIAFKDKNGTTRIKRAYVYNGSSAQEYTNITSSSPTTDDNTEDHGTHTSSIAGGSSVIISGSSVTVTDDHASATYGGMAPGADLYLAGIKNLNDTYLANAVNNMCTYANQQNKPLVVSNSWGSQWGPHDGTGDVADVYNSLFGDTHPNRVALFAASNDAGNAPSSEGGGYHISGTATSANPLGSILRCSYYSDTDNGYYYYGAIANAWSRAGTSTIMCKIYVLNKSTGAILASTTVTPTANGAAVSGLSSYYSGTIYAYKDYISANGKTQTLLYTSGLQTRSASNYVSNYTLAVEFYPQNGSATIDVWGGNYCYYSNFLSTPSHAWTAGSDDMSVSDEATMPNVISIGAYISTNRVTDYNGTSHNLAGSFPTIGDIAYFSSYATANESPTGLQYPWITAPGATIVSAVNHYDTSGDLSYINGNSAQYGLYRVNSNTTSPYGSMEGTSMATPAAAGIVALWLQASLENNAQHKNLTVNDVKQIMQETAIHDQYTDGGANASHFGNGKIDALAGIQYILGLTGGTITVDPIELTFGGSDFWAGNSQSLTVVVTNTTDEALQLTIAGLNASLSGTPFSVTAITNNGNVAAGGGTVTITITYAPTVVSANDQATLTIAEDVTVALTGSCVQAPEPYAASVNPVEGTIAYGTVTTGNTVTHTITITNEGSQSFTPVVNVNAPFEANYNSSPLAPGESCIITVTFTPDQVGDYSEVLTIVAAESDDISFTYTLTGTGEAPYIASTVNPTTLDFTNKVLGRTYTATVTIANTGTQVFTPVINVDNMPAEYTVTGVTQVTIGNSINLTVTYSPTAVGTHNGSFTVTIGDVTTTVNVYGSAIEVTDATVADGNTTNTYLPIYGNQYANKQINQMIYPASMLTEIQGKKIKSMKFYAERINFSGGAFNVKMGITNSTTFPRTYSRITANMTTVKTGQAAESGGTELVITFDQPFEYTDGNLVIDFEVTQTNTNSTTRFYGINPGGYTSFYSYGTTTNSYGRYTAGGTRLQFLPKVTFEWDAPYIAGSVDPLSLTFTDVPIGRSQEQTVSVANTGTLPFTPVIDTTNLPAEFTVTGGDVVAVGGSLGLTVTYTPTDEGPHNGSFTVTIGDATYTVTVTGNGIVVNSTLFSNEVMVPVYKSNIRANGDTYIFAESDVLGDIDMNLEYPANSSSIEVLAKADEPILRYDLHHKIGEDGNWTYPDGAAVATATHNGNSYVVNSETFTFPQDATEMWISMNDSQLNNATEVTYYVPVTIANGKVTTGEPNTYGAPFAQSQLDPVSIEVRVGGVKSSVIDHYGNHTGEWEGPNGVNYCVYMPVVTVLCQQLNGTTHVPYLYRAWLLANDFVDYYNYAHDPQEGFYGTTVKQMPYLLAEKGIDDIGDPTYVTLGEAGDTYEGQNTFGAPVDDPGIVIAVRVYYQRADELSGHMLRAGGGYGFGQGSGRGDGIQTGINELINGKQVVDVQYVNTLGMQSSEPFDGVNIVITRYSDGSTSTAKVVK